jgi:hypothetical protein
MFVSFFILLSNKALEQFLGKRGREQEKKENREH